MPKTALGVRFCQAGEQTAWADAWFSDLRVRCLHDTNRRELFAEDNRALSHDCARVEDWAELAAFVLDVDLAEVHRRAYGRRTFDAPAPPIPVELGYYTRFFDASGRIVTYTDVYNLDSLSGQSAGAVEGREMACIIALAQ